MGRGRQSGGGGGRSVLRLERISDHLTFAQGARRDGRHFAETFLSQANSPHLAVVFPGYRIRPRAVTYHGEPASTVVLRRRVSSFRRQLGARSLWQAGVDRVSTVDGLDRGAVLFGLAAS